MTPALAALMLEHNDPDNRPLDPDRAARYAQAYLDGTMPTGRPIEFTGYTLVNGQHRLAAIVLCGRAVEVDVEWA